MQNTLSFPTLPSADLELNPAFNVVIAYEDFETGKRAMKTYDYLVQHLGEECTFKNQMWKFEVLALPKLREMAVKDASTADIIIVSAHGPDVLGYAVRDWVERWLAEERNAIALVGLFDSDSYFENPARRYLAETARRANLEFFSQPGLWPVKSGGNKSSDDEAWERNKTFSVLASVVREETAVSHWGINE